VTTPNPFDPPVRIPNCAIAKARERLDAVALAQLDEALTAVDSAGYRTVSTLRIAKGLEALGVPVSRAVVDTHRRRLCACYRGAK
jgi:hypothetical protein